MCGSKHKVLMINKLLFARIASLSLIAVLLVGGIACAAADESRFDFADKQASIVLAPGVTARPVGGLPPETELFYLMRGTKRVLGIYVGNAPDTTNTGTAAPMKETLAGYTALNYVASDEHGRSRQTFVEVKDQGWPNVIHFFYSGASAEDAEMADKMIESLQIAGAPAAQK